MTIMNNLTKKIAIFLPSLYGGGAEKTMLNLASGIADRGYKVDLVLVKAKGVYFDQVSKKIRVVDLRASRSIMCYPALVHYLRTEKPECILSALHVNIIAILARFLAGVSTRVFVSERNTISKLAKNSSDLRLTIISKLIRYVYPFADGIIAVSKGVAKDLADTAQISYNSIQVIYNPVVTPLLRKKTEASLNHPWFKDNTPPVILGVGSLTIQKNFGLLIEAYAKLVQTHKARLLILGEGDKRSELESMVRRLKLNHSVLLPGFVSNPYPYMVRAAVFVLPSLFEGLPGVLIEALYCGIPIVATDCPGGSVEIIENVKYGKIVPVGDAEALAGAIKSVLNNKKHNQMTESWQQFELDTVVDQYLNLLLRV
jgi:glycosyltransferase involved in cell wall biosynthesis